MDTKLKTLGQIKLNLQHTDESSFAQGNDPVLEFQNLERVKRALPASLQQKLTLNNVKNFKQMKKVVNRRRIRRLKSNKIENPGGNSITANVNNKLPMHVTKLSDKEAKKLVKSISNLVQEI